MKKLTSKFIAAGLLAATLAAFGITAQATVIDLVTGDSGTANGAQFNWTPQQPTGTGVIEPFLRVQADGTEQGYNTSGGTPFDDMAGIWTHDIQFSDLQATAVTLNGTQYFQLLLDVNEPGGNQSLISLDRLEFYTSPIGSKTTTDVGSLGTLRWSLDGAGDSYVLLDASRNNGSGSGDMLAYIPVSAFAGASDTDYIYMFSRFGDQSAADGMTEGGFEEWSLVNSMTPVPEMSAFFPIVGLFIAIGSTQLLRRRRGAQIAKDPLLS
ncbi:MAG: hypothetical protein H0W86_10680 [Armatimonadetes bacterium]|nr:hypothetical protein [Armatimonadota bacterium]